MLQKQSHAYATRKREGAALLRRIAIALLAIVLLLICTLVSLRRMDGIYRAGQAMPIRVGFSPDLAQVEVPQGRCVLVRVTSQQCSFCKKDQRQYERLVAEAQQANCATVAIGPRVGDMRASVGGTRSSEYVDFAIGGTLSWQYIDLAVGRALMPFVTPQTLIVDSSGRLVWQRREALDDDDLVAASHALGRLR